MISKCRRRLGSFNKGPSLRFCAKMEENLEIKWSLLAALQCRWKELKEKKILDTGSREKRNAEGEENFTSYILVFFPYFQLEIFKWDWGPLPICARDQLKGGEFWNFNCWNAASVSVLGLRFQFLAFPCTRRGPFSKIYHIYIKTLRTKPWAWFRGLFYLIMSCTQNDDF